MEYRSIGTLAANVLTSPLVTSAASGSIQASFTDSGISVTAALGVTVSPPPITAYYGVAPIPTGSYAAIDWSAFVLSLSQGATGRATSFALNIGAGQYGWYAAPTNFGITTDVQFLDADTGNIGGGWGGATSPIAGAAPGSPPRLVTATVNGTAVQFKLWRTDYPNLGSTHWNIA